TFTATPGQQYLTLPASGITGRSIVLVRVRTENYRPLEYDDSLRPGMNYFLFDEATRRIEFVPPPVLGGPGIVRYFLVPTQEFTTGNLTQEPQVPEQYHEALVLGLAMRIAKAHNDVALGNNYASEYNTMLQLAQQNCNLNNMMLGNTPVRSGGR